MLIKSISIIFGLASSLAVQASMQPMSDDELGNAVGQAFFQIDRTEGANGFDFTRFTFGMDVEVSLNADLIEFGRYPRAGETAPSDIRINDFALGSIENGVIKPFRIQDPFFELAFDSSTGSQDLVGIRFGFGGAVGALSGSIETLTGNVNVDIKDTAQVLNQAGDGSNYIGQILTALGPWLLGNSPLESRARLVTDNGNITQIRARKVGIPNGFQLRVDTTGVSIFNRSTLSWVAGLLPNTECQGGYIYNPCASALVFTASNCSLDGGIQTCFDLKNYRTLDIGKKVGDRFEPTSGMFLSFQSRELTWLENDGTQTPTVSGAFLNIPNGGLEITLVQAVKGTERLQTKFIDPYF